MERNSPDRERGFELYYLMMHKAKKKYEIGKVSDTEEAKQRQLRAILNKLTPQNFNRLFQQVKAVNIDNAITLFGFVSQIFEKALMEPIYCEMYANFCFHLAFQLPDFSVDNEKITFKRLLLDKCQKEFERGEREREQEEANKVDEAEAECEVKLSNEEKEQRRTKARRRMLGNITLIGEMYKKKMLTERIMHECIKKLLGQCQDSEEEDVEALCKLMSTIGEVIDHPKAKEHMDVYFERLKILSNNMNLSSRMRFMLKDVIDLRRNRWQVRRKVDGPKKIEGVHKDVVQERQAQAQAGRMGRGMGNNQSARSNPMLRNDYRNLNRWQRSTSFQQGVLIPSPQSLLQMMHKVEKKYDAEEAKQRKLRAILNKLTPQNFDWLLEQVKAVNIDNAITLIGFVSQIFEKALMEPIYCEMYANFCFHLAFELPDLSVDNKKITFKKFLINKCQEEFERGEREREQEEANKVDVAEGEVKLSNEEREQRRTKARARGRMSGNIRLIGELYKMKMLPDIIMHECIKRLPGQCQDPDEDDVEAMCKLMSSIGEMIDRPKVKERMDVYFERLKILSNNMNLSSRVRFMLKDVIDLRRNGWHVRWKVDDPKTIEKVHRDAVQESQAQAQAGRMGRGMGNNQSARSNPMLRNDNRNLSRPVATSPHAQSQGPIVSQNASSDERLRDMCLSAENTTELKCVGF